jgi:hypothetical protein
VTDCAPDRWRSRRFVAGLACGQFGRVRTSNEFYRKHGDDPRCVQAQSSRR